MLDPMLHALWQIGLTLAVGSSTFALIFYFKAIADNVIDATERSFLHTVYFVLRIGLVILIVSEVFSALANISNPAYFADPDFLMRITLLAVIIGNASLMQFHAMPMWLGPALAGGSWYSYFALSVFSPTGLPYAMLISFYLAFVALSVLGLHTIEGMVRKRPNGH